MSETINNWNNQIRATNASLALAAYLGAKGEVEGPDEDDIEHLIIDLIHLKFLLKPLDSNDLVKYSKECVVAATKEEADLDWGEVVYENWPDGGREELLKWEGAYGPFSRTVIEAPPE